MLPVRGGKVLETASKLSIPFRMLLTSFLIFFLATSLRFQFLLGCYTVDYCYVNIKTYDIFQFLLGCYAR